MEDRLFFGAAGAGANGENDSGVVEASDSGGFVFFNEGESVRFAGEVVRFTGDELSFGLPFLVSEFGLFPFDPGEPRDDSHSEGVLVEVQGRGYPDASVGWVDGDVEVFDLFLDDLYGESADVQVVCVGFSSHHGFSRVRK